MDFYKIRTRDNKDGSTDVYPSFTVGRSTELMVRGGKFYAIWDERLGLWSTDEYEVARMVDHALFEYRDNMNGLEQRKVSVKDMQSYETGSWAQFQRFISQVGDNSVQLDQNLTFSNTEVKKESYVSKRLPYALTSGDYSAWDELVGTLYSVEERAKIEWAIGAVVSGDAKRIQKFLVLYGSAGTGKSTILNIVEKLFTGYTTTFEAKALGGNNNQFATEVFKNSPLVAIQHDGDLSKIEDNTKLNSIISHEEMTMNEKFKSSYTSAVLAFLMMGTNQPVKISDSKSGIIRRLIDVHPTGVIIKANHYTTLLSRIDFELGAIAQHCLDVYLDMGKNHYNAYRPLEMMLQTDVFFNFIEAYFDIFSAQNGCSLAQAYLLYKEYCSETGIDHILPKYKFRGELRSYFDEFKDRAEVEGQVVRSYYEGFNANKFKAPTKEVNTFSLVIEESESLLDVEFADQPAQGATSRETPKKKWADVTSTLADLDTTDLHFVRVPENHVVIDFDLKDEAGEKSLERNLEAASRWPATYAELSKSGAGVHLHYNYDGDVTQLASLYSDGIEVKTLLGDASLRRRLTKCNHIPVATISSGLPIKEKKVLTEQTLKTERGLRDLIDRTMKGEFHPGTASNVSFIKKILDDAYELGIAYDVTDLRSRVTVYGNNSSNQALKCLKMIQEMKFKSEAEVQDGDAPAHMSPSEKVESDQAKAAGTGLVRDDRIAFYDVEVYPNLFVICWKFEDSETVVRMVNPPVEDVLALMRLKLVGFYNRRYDNHIIYAAAQGFTVERLYKLSQKMVVGNDKNAMFGAAYNLSYADIWDFSSKKQSLKKFEIELGIKHVEMDLSWDEPVPAEKVDRVVEYCVNDVMATEATFKARKQDFVARQILADLSGLTVNDPTPKHTAKIIFGDDKNPQRSFVHTKLERDFPGYDFDASRIKEGKSHYRGEVVGEGGYVYAEPGMYSNVAVLDVASMHPTSIEQLNYFGPYTPKFAALKAARVAIKHGDYDSARGMLDGKLAPYLKDEKDAKALSYALKIVINIVYGLTGTTWENVFKDPRNKDNVVAKRGALFMIDLKHFVQERGFQVVHIKTDSIKIPNATPEIIDEVYAFGQKWGYDFEHEDTYQKFCLVNDAVYIARKSTDDWEAVGAQFQHPYVYKTLFSGEEITFNDYGETKQVSKGAIYLDFEHDTPMVTAKEGLRFVGRTGRFVPVEEGQNGARLYRVHEDKHYKVTGTSKHLWLEADMARDTGAKIDLGYFEGLVREAETAIGKFGDFEEFVR